MLLKDKYKPTFLDEFIINKDIAKKCNKIVSKNFIPHLLFHGPSGCGKYTLCRCIINSIYDEEIKTFDSIFKIDNKEYTLNCSEYHFEIFIDKYNSNKNSLFEIIDYLTETRDINQVCLTKIIVLRNLNYCNNDVFSYLKNKIEVSGNNYRFFITTNNISYIPNLLRGLFFYIKINYEKEQIVKDFLKYNKVKFDEKLLKNCRNLNIFFTKNELLTVCKSKTFTEIKEKQLIKLIHESSTNPDNILKIRHILYEINIKNLKVIEILKNILSHFLNSKIDESKKYKLCELFAKYDHRTQMSYKTQVHYEALFMQIIYLLNT